MIKPSILLVTAGSFLAGFGAKTLVDSSTRAAAAKRLLGVVAEAEIKNVSKLYDQRCLRQRPGYLAGRHDAAAVHLLG